MLVKFLENFLKTKEDKGGGSSSEQPRSNGDRKGKYKFHLKQRFDINMWVAL